jgi:nucleotide-binding universal stress UspA family protein
MGGAVLMPDILAFSTGAEDQRSVQEVTTALAKTLHLTEEQHPLPATGAALLRVVEDPDVRLAVLPYVPGVTDQLVTDVMGRSSKPLVLVPPDGAPGSDGLVSRVLVPLDGTVESAETVAETVDLFASSGADIVVLHVFDETTVPKFWDQPVHARRSWDEEFLARYCDQPDARLELRSGSPGESIVDVAASERPDLIAMGWSQDLTAGRAQTVRTTVERSGTPVLLLAVRGTHDRSSSPGSAVPTRTGARS